MADESSILLGILCLLSFYKAAVPAGLRGISTFSLRSAQRRFRRRDGPPMLRFGQPLKPLSSRTVTSGHPPLARIFGDDIIAAAIAKNLYYADIINLCLVSRSMRAAVFPASLSSRREILRVASCSMGKKGQCWCCGTQTCNVSDTHFGIGQPQLNAT